MNAKRNSFIFIYFYWGIVGVQYYVFQMCNVALVFPSRTWREHQRSGQGHCPPFSRGLPEPYRVRTNPGKGPPAYSGPPWVTWTHTATLCTQSHAVSLELIFLSGSHSSSKMNSNPGQRSGPEADIRPLSSLLVNIPKENFSIQLQLQMGNPQTLGKGRQGGDFCPNHFGPQFSRVWMAYWPKKKQQEKKQNKS